MLQRLEEDKVQNLEKMEQMVMRDGDIVPIMQQIKEDKAQKYMDKK